MKIWGKHFLNILLAALLLWPQGIVPVDGAVFQKSVQISPNKENGDNRFIYYAYEGKSWIKSGDEAYIHLGAMDDRAEECYYEVVFFGNGIELFAVKDAAHGKVRYSVDGGQESEADLYSASRTQPLSVYKVSGLEEKAHILKAVTLREKSGSAIVNQVSYAKISYTEDQPDGVLGGTVSDINTQHTQAQYETLSGQDTKTAELAAWKNDKALSELVLYAKDGSVSNVKVTAGDLRNSKGYVIDAKNITASFIKSTSAYNKGYVLGTAVPAVMADNRSEVSDIIDRSDPVSMQRNSIQPVWVEFSIPKDAKAGTYKGSLTVTADRQESLVFTYVIHVLDAVLPDASGYAGTFDIELWQYPYKSAEYYGVEPFSAEHFAILRPAMEKYKQIGGHAITASIVEDAWSGGFYQTNDIPYPSMVKWKKSGDRMTYDYSDFDAWVSFNKELGIGDKIVLYSIAPWHDSFTYWENGVLQKEIFKNGSGYTARYLSLWTDFLRDLIRHLEEKGWFDNAYIGIDERGFSAEAFDLIDSVKGSNGKALKTAGAMDSFVEKKPLALRVFDLNVGSTAAAAHPTEFARLVRERTEKGFKTTIYSCTGHMPGNFALSAPVESYWTIANAAKLKTAGFLRWAYDAWTADPLTDVTHSRFEPGDCFLLYPDQKDAQNPVCKSSVRLERMAEGVRDINKLMALQKWQPELASSVQSLYDGITMTAKSRPSNENAYLPAAQVQTLSREMDAFKAGIAALTVRYVAEEKSLSDTVESVTIANGASVLIAAGDVKQLAASVLPANALDTDVFWSSSDDETAAVDGQGNLTGKKEGTAVIMVKSAWNPEKMASIAVTVTKKEEIKEEIKDVQEEIKKQPEDKQPSAPAAGEEFTDGELRFRILSVDAKTGTAAAIGAAAKEVKKAIIPDQITYRNYIFTVTEIDADAFAGLKKLAFVQVGKNVAQIGAGAFSGSRNLGRIRFMGKTMPKLQGKKVFSGIPQKCRIDMPKKMNKKQRAAWKKTLKAAGMKKMSGI